MRGIEESIKRRINVGLVLIRIRSVFGIAYTFWRKDRRVLALFMLDLLSDMPLRTGPNDGLVGPGKIGQRELTFVWSSDDRREDLHAPLPGSLAVVVTAIQGIRQHLLRPNPSLLGCLNQRN